MMTSKNSGVDSEMTTVLVIEGEEPTRTDLIELLETNQFQAIAAAEGQLGLQLAAERLPDLILCDGCDVLKELKQQPGIAAIPVILLSAEVAETGFRGGMDLGADDCLSKPIDPGQLLKAIAARLEKRTSMQQQYEQKLEQLLQYDRLTQLPNRLALRDRFAQFLEIYHLDETQKLATTLVPILCLSVDRFHRIHDHLGYAWGDRLLRGVAQRLKEAVGDRGLAAYLNADEFALVLPPVEHKREVLDEVGELKAQFSQPFRLKKQEISLTASIGISLYPRDGRKIEKLLRRAKRATNDVKRKGGNSTGFYTAVLNIGKSNTLTLESEFRKAWERQELEIHYQPKVELKSGTIVSCEALLRWQHPERGRIAPDKFMPMAEELGLMEAIGEWVLQTSGRQLKAWHKAGWNYLRMAVNISSRQFNQIDLRQRIAKILADIPLAFQYIELEFTEPSLIQNPAIASQRLNAFKALGMQLSIDDFGTGYSSLNYLRRFPFDALKLDPCFIHNLVNSPSDRAITQAIIQMAQALNMKTIAEGVENEEELEFLREFGCDELQGYLFSPPLPAPEFTKLLEDGKRLL